MQNHKIVIQARTHSSRLPNKVIKPFFHDHSILDIVCKRLLLYYDASQIIIASSVLDKHSTIASIAEHHAIDVYWGDEEDVLKRVINAAKRKYGEGLLRVCAHNPFLDIETMAQLVTSAETYDYCAFETVSSKNIGIAETGLFAEYVSTSALETLYLRNQDKGRPSIDFCQTLSSLPDLFAIKTIPIHTPMENDALLRLTVDSDADFKWAQTFFIKLIETAGWKFNYRDVWNVLASRAKESSSVSI